MSELTEYLVILEERLSTSQNAINQANDSAENFKVSVVDVLRAVESRLTQIEDRLEM